MKTFIEFINEDNLTEVIVHKDGKWIVMTKDKSRVLGAHDNKEDADAQLAAIEIAKHAK